MHSGPPPYRPFRGADPPHFVDRASEEEDLGTSGVVSTALEAYKQGPCDVRFHRLVAAGPAMGKTALLRALCRQVQALFGWAAVLHRCRAKERAMGMLRSQVVASVGRQWGDARAGAGSSVDGGEAWSDLKTVLERCGRTASGLGCGLLVALDDVDLLGAGEAEAFGYLARRLTLERLPVAFVFTGRPWLVRRFERAGNFSGTVWTSTLEPFDPGEAREAIVVPAAERGVEFEDRALELACAAARGSPLAVQRIGFASWAAAGGRPSIGAPEVEEALAGPVGLRTSVAAAGWGGWSAAGRLTVPLRSPGVSERARPAFSYRAGVGQGPRELAAPAR